MLSNDEIETRKKILTTDIIKNEFKGYSTFVEVANPTLKAYNQWSVLSNLKEARLFQLMEDYLDNLPRSDVLGIQIISEYINHHGLDETRRELTFNGVFA